MPAAISSAKPFAFRQKSSEAASFSPPPWAMPSSIPLPSPHQSRPTSGCNISLAPISQKQNGYPHDDSVAELRIPCLTAFCVSSSMAVGFSPLVEPPATQKPGMVPPSKELRMAANMFRPISIPNVIRSAFVRARSSLADMPTGGLVSSNSFLDITPASFISSANASIAFSKWSNDDDSSPSRRFSRHGT
eukprot:CAMPEP_0183763018 /NCGR_PEP_ID=MMETSP0739-20130205/9423_1 /TAXON_ID=385413 /ORGANISM="Thalassiosira miniscula, Strain CCMP1093" /LENGTH=189 /DNA_ID=CAMNT_0026001363 /DNA_START=380 /DNA_END=949 /DNA_ORIENTATION=+